MSISSAALRPARTAASMTGSGAPTKVTTVRLVAGRVDVEQLDAVDGLDRVGDLAQDGGVASFAEVGDALDQSIHGVGPGAVEGGRVGRRDYRGDVSTVPVIFLSFRAVRLRVESRAACDPKGEEDHRHRTHIRSGAPARSGSPPRAMSGS